MKPKTALLLLPFLIGCGGGGTNSLQTAQNRSVNLPSQATTYTGSMSNSFGTLLASDASMMLNADGSFTLTAPSYSNFSYVGNVVTAAGDSNTQGTVTFNSAQYQAGSLPIRQPATGGIVGSIQWVSNGVASQIVNYALN